MEVWVLEKYYTTDSISYVLDVFENVDVAMNTVNDHEDIMWTQNDITSDWMSNEISNVIYYLTKWEVILDEMPIAEINKEI